MLGKRSLRDGRGGRPGKRRNLPGQSSYAKYSEPLPNDLAATCSLPSHKNVSTFLGEVFNSGRYKGRDHSNKIDWTRNKVVVLKGWTKNSMDNTKNEGDGRKDAKLLSLRSSFGSQGWRRKKGLDDLRNVEYSTVEKLHRLWGEYAKNALKMYKKPEEAIFEMDMHGARITVERAKSARFVGLTGLVLRDQLECFELIFPDNRKTVVSKRGTEFSMEIGRHRVLVNGSRIVDVLKGTNTKIKFQVEGITGPT